MKQWLKRTNINRYLLEVSKDLYWFFNGKPTGELKKLANWALSEEGQKLAEAMDYVPLPKEKAVANMME